jgi:hypothetical protein
MANTPHNCLPLAATNFPPLDPAIHNYFIRDYIQHEYEHQIQLDPLSAKIKAQKEKKGWATVQK